MTSKFRVLKNGSDVMQFADLQTWGGGSFEYPTEISFFINLAAGDYIEFQAQSGFNDRSYSVRYPYGFGMMRFGA